MKARGRLNGRLKHVPRTMRVHPVPHFVAATAFATKSNESFPDIDLESFCYRNELLRIEERNVAGGMLKFHRLTEGPAALDDIVERFGESTFVRAAHIASFMQRLTRLVRTQSEDDFESTVTFFIRTEEQPIAVRVGYFDRSNKPRHFSFGATHPLPDVHMGLIGHY